MPKTKFPTIRIKYVDSDAIESFPVHEWPFKRADRVDWVEIGHTFFTRLGGQSIYWLYPSTGGWVLGAGPIGCGDMSPEVVVDSEDNHNARRIEHMPDLMVANIKLGWTKEGN